MQPFSLNDKNIVVTGASSGIGRAIAIMLSEAGARLILIARRDEELQHTLTLMRGNDHIAIVHDLTVNDQLEDSCKKMYQDPIPVLHPDIVATPY